MHVLDEWGLSGKDIISIFVLALKTRLHHLEGFRDGPPSPDDQKIKERLERTTGIADALAYKLPMQCSYGRYMHAYTSQTVPKPNTYTAN